MLNMNKKSKIKLLMKSLFVQFGQVQCDNGVTLLYEEDTELIVGYKVYVEREAENGDIEYVAPEDGEYTSGNTVFTIENGVCVKIENNEVAEPDNTESEQLAEEAPAEEAPAEEVIIEDPAPEKDEFDARKAIEDLRAEYDAKINDLNDQVRVIKEQLDAFLALPAEENAFHKETGDDKKPIFKSKK